MSPTSPTKHKCAAHDCPQFVSHRMLMCLACWRRVPHELQTAVNRAYRKADQSGRAVLSRAYVNAVRAAVAAVTVSRARERGLGSTSAQRELL